MPLKNFQNFTEKYHQYSYLITRLIRVAFATQFVIQNNEIGFFPFGVETKSQLEHLLDIDSNWRIF